MLEFMLKVIALGLLHFGVMGFLTWRYVYGKEFQGK